MGVHHCAVSVQVVSISLEEFSDYERECDLARDKEGCHGSALLCACWAGGVFYIHDARRGGW